jgi:hypothetical protein
MSGNQGQEDRHPAGEIRPVPDEKAGRVEIAEDLWLYRRFTLEHRAGSTESEPPFSFDLTAELSDGTYEVVEFRAFREKPTLPSVTSAGLRQVTIQELIIGFVKRNIYTRSGHRAIPPGPPDAPRNMDDEAGLQAVATIYALARAAGDSTTHQVALSFDRSRATAGRWVRAAREQGYIAVPGKDR